MNPLRPSPALVGVAVFFCFAPVARSASSQPPQSVLLSQEQCRHSFNSGDSAIYKDDGTTLKPEFDPKNNCDKNAGEETLSHNAAAVEEAKEILKVRPAFATSGGLYELKSKGACKIAYGGVREVFDFFAKSQAEYCEKLNEAWNAANDCGSFDKACKKQWEAFRDVNKSFAASIQEKGKAAVLYLNTLALAAGKAREKYEVDLSKLEPVIQRRSLTVAASNVPLGDILTDAPEVKATNGNKATQNAEKPKALELYYQLLKGSDLTGVATVHAAAGKPQRGLLIQEEDIAVKNLKTFGMAIQMSLARYRDTANNVADTMNEQLARMDQNGTTNTDSTVTNKINKYAPVVTAAAPLAQSMLKPPGAGDLSGLGQVAAAAHGVPVAGLAAAAGLGALAAHSFDGTSRSGGPAAGPSEAPAVAPAPAPSHADTNTLGEPPAGRSPGTGAGSPAANNVKNDGPAKGDAEGGGSPAGSGAGLSEGSSSRAPAGKKGLTASNAPASSGSPIDAGGAGTPEGMGSFGQNLTPQPAPKAATASPGSEVANLLGQMKNLFNFDESNPLGGGPGAPLPGGVPSPADGAYNAAAAAAAAGEPGAPAEAGEAPAGTAAAAPASAAYGEETRGSPFGKVDTSLFARVRARHHRCMERGLVLYGLKERVE